MHPPYVKFVSGVPTPNLGISYLHVDVDLQILPHFFANRLQRAAVGLLSSCYLPYTSHRGAFLMSRRRLPSRSARPRRRRRRFITELTQSGTTTTTTTELLSRQQRRHWRRTRSFTALFKAFCRRKKVHLTTLRNIHIESILLTWRLLS